MILKNKGRSRKRKST